MLARNSDFAPSAKLQLLSNEVHIWSANTKTSIKNLKQLLHTFSEDEVERANRFKFKKDRRKYILARGLLRRILSYYCEDEPSDLMFTYNRYGKPSLAMNKMLNFNISHSGEQILYIIAWNREVGIDIEQVRPFENAEKIVEMYFSQREKEEFVNVPKHMKTSLFFTCWTRKEAYIKAQGKGMFLPFDQFSISFIPGEPARLIETQHDESEKNRWTVRNILTKQGYRAAAVVKGHNLFFKYWKLKPDFFLE